MAPGDFGLALCGDFRQAPAPEPRPKGPNEQFDQDLAEPELDKVEPFDPAAPGDEESIPLEQDPSDEVVDDRNNDEAALDTDSKSTSALYVPEETATSGIDKILVEQSGYS